MASIYRALAEHEKAEAYPEAVEQAHTDYAALRHGDQPAFTRPDRPASASGSATIYALDCRPNNAPEQA